MTSGFGVFLTANRYPPTAAYFGFNSSQLVSPQVFR
jgi:hypothetical protein